MPKYWAPVRDLGKYGIVKDGDPLTVPLNAWTDATNAWFTTKGVGVLVGDRVLPMTPNTILSFRLAYSIIYGPGYVFGTYDKLYIRDNSFGSLTDVSRVSNYTGGNWRFDIATNGTYGGYIAANGVNEPQYYTGAIFANLPSWPAGVAASIIKPFKNFLVAVRGNIVQWSHSIPTTSSLPTSWSVSNPAEDGGEQYLQTFVIRDILPLGDSMFVYAIDGVWEMRYIGYPFVFAFNRVFPSLRVLYDRCVCRFVDGVEKHFVISGNNFFVHDGRQLVSILDDRMRQYLFETLFGGTQGEYAFCIPRHMDKEIWCFMRTTSGPGGPPTTHVIWNWETNKWTVRTAPADTQYYDAWYFDGRPDTIALVSMNSANTQRKFRDIPHRSYASNDVNTLTLTLEKRGLSPVVSQGQTVNDAGRKKTLHSIRLWTQDIGTGYTISIQLGASDGSPDNIAYTYTGAFTPYSGQKHETLSDFTLEGRWFAVKIVVTPTAATGFINNGLIIGYDLELTEHGLY